MAALLEEHELRVGDARRCDLGGLDHTRAIVEAGDGLRLERGVLVAYDTRAEVLLQQIIFGAASVDSVRARVDAVPPETTWATRSK